MALDGYSDTILSRQARRAELLDQPTEAALGRAWRDERDHKALNRLVESHMRLAIAMASRFRRHGAPMGDLIQEASLGLMKAADKFDPERGVRFSTYATWWIKAALQDFVMRNWSLVRTGSTSSQKSLFFNLRRLEAKFAREAEARGEVPVPDLIRAQVAVELGVPLADVQMMAGRMGGQDFSLNATQGGDEDGREWMDLLEDEAPAGAAGVEAARDGAVLRLEMAAALAGLPARERYIVVERRLRGEGRTLESLGAELGLTKERIRQLEASAFARLRKTLETSLPGVHDFLS
jgi:RNA polymerase sigma-32 factor